MSSPRPSSSANSQSLFYNSGSPRSSLSFSSPVTPSQSSRTNSSPLYRDPRTQFDASLKATSEYRAHGQPTQPVLGSPITISKKPDTSYTGHSTHHSSLKAFPHQKDKQTLRRANSPKLVYPEFGPYSDRRIPDLKLEIIEDTKPIRE